MNRITATASYLCMYVIYRNAHVRSVYKAVNRYIASIRTPFEFSIKQEAFNGTCEFSGED